MRIEKWVSQLQISRKFVIPRQSYGRKLFFTYSFLEIQEFTISSIFREHPFYILEIVIFGNQVFPSFSVHFNQSVLTDMFVWTVGRYKVFIKKVSWLRKTLPKKSQRWVFHFSRSLCKWQIPSCGDKTKAFIFWTYAFIFWT